MHKNINTHAKIISVFVLLSVSVAVLFSTRGNPPGYTLSFYASTPAIVWIAIIAAITISIVFFFQTRLSVRMYLVLLSAIYLCLLWIPIFQNYGVYPRNGDILAHLGYSKTIVKTGYINRTHDIYPLYHIIITILSQFLGLNIKTIPQIVNPLFSIGFIWWIYSFGRTIFGSVTERRYAVLAATPLLFSIFHTSTVPAIFTFFLIPLFLTFYWKYTRYNRTQYAFILILIAISIVFFHVIVGIFLVVILFSDAILNQLYTYVPRDRIDQNYSILSLVLILLIIIPILLLSFYRGQQAISSLLYSILAPTVQATSSAGVTKPSIIARVATLIAQTDPASLVLFRVFFLRFGPIFLYAGVAALGIVYLFYNRSIDNTSVFLSVNFVIGVIVGGLFFFFPIIVGSPVRVSRFGLLFALLLIPKFVKVLCDTITLPRRETFVRFAFLGLILTTTIIGVFSIYPSPLTFRAGPEITDQLNDGQEWYIDHRDRTIGIRTFSLQIDKFEEYYYGYSRAEDNRGRRIRTPISSHFTSETNSSFCTQSPKQYMATTAYMQKWDDIYPPSFRDTADQFLASDFEKVNSQQSIKKIYSNGEFNLWMLCSGRSH